MAPGWVKLYREVINDEVFKPDRNGSYFLFALWGWCLTEANYLPGKWNGRIIHPGQFVTGRKKGSRVMNCTQTRFRDGLLRLQKLGSINVEPDNDFTLVTICNWDTYQSGEDSNPTATRQQPDSNPTATRHNRRRKERKKERKKERSYCG